MSNRAGKGQIGGNVRIGASIAVNDERNNYLSHEQQRQKIEELNKATTDEEKDAIKKKWDKISDDQTNNANIEVVGSIVYSKDNSEIYIAGEAPPIVVTAKRYVFDWKAIWDGVAGLARGVTGVQGEDYFDRSGRYKYWYSVGNRAMPLALQAAGIRGGFNSFSMSRDFEIGYNGTYAQAGTVDAWLGWDSIILSSNPLGNSDKNLQQDRLQATTRESEGPGNAVFKTGKTTVQDIAQNPKALSGKSAEEIAQMLRDSGYEVTVEASKKSTSGAQIIKINNPGEGRNITQVQVSPGGGRHGANPYVKISTSDQGIIKVVDGVSDLYKTDGAETANIIFTGGK